ncbi:MAG TPA: N-6 DNA methylase, partial [Lacipirellulaceae bacterium]|nr:N-6 DNA methylase [Lacipirellulaceae bacterium]
MLVADAKEKGAYYTPLEVASSLVRWAVHGAEDRMLDPSCGDGQFLALHSNAAGIEQDTSAVALAARRTKARIYVGDFFEWAKQVRERFDCAVGNPPFIRYQRFSGDVRQRALDLCAEKGVNFSSLTASWAPFLVGAASLLKSGGRLAFVVPAEIGHAGYAAPLIEYLARSFSKVQFIAIRESVFPELSQDVWLLFASGFGDSTQHIQLTRWNSFRSTEQPPKPNVRISLSDWRGLSCRLRPFVLPNATLELYQQLSELETTFRFGSAARVGIGYVTGDNDFFHLRPSHAKSLRIPEQCLMPTVRNGRALPTDVVDSSTVSTWIKRDDPFLLLRLRQEDLIPSSVRRYLDSESARTAKASYKCRNREPWYAVPDVTVPDGFLAYMSGASPALVANAAGCACTNSVHAVRMKNGFRLSEIQRVWQHPVTKISTELEGHPLGGGLLKLEPREASRILLPKPRLFLS